MSQIKQEIVVNWEAFFWSAYPDKVLSYKTTEVYGIKVIVAVDEIQAL